MEEGRRYLNRQINAEHSRGEHGNGPADPNSLWPVSSSGSRSAMFPRDPTIPPSADRNPSARKMGKTYIRLDHAEWGGGPPRMFSLFALHSWQHWCLAVNYNAILLHKNDNCVLFYLTIAH